MNDPLNPVSKRLLLNCDMGESFGPWRMGQDDEIMPLIDMANIACGFHASDPLTMTHTVLLAKQAGTGIGAHPSYPDLVGFGRRSMQCSRAEIISLILYQVGALEGISRAYGSAISYVKPHGALYNDMMEDEDILRSILEAMASYEHKLPLVVLAKADNQNVQTIADEFDVPLLFEAFADRAYNDKGLLVPRAKVGAVYHDKNKIVEQAVQLAQEGTFTTQGGHPLPLNADTLCVHGDNAASVPALKIIRSTFDRYYSNRPNDCHPH